MSIKNSSLFVAVITDCYAHYAPLLNLFAHNYWFAIATSCY